MESTPKRVFIYEDQTGTAPYSEWLDHLRDQQAAAKIMIRITRIQFGGNLGAKEYWKDFKERYHGKESK